MYRAIDYTMSDETVCDTEIDVKDPCARTLLSYTPRFCMTSHTQPYLGAKGSRETICTRVHFQKMA